MNYNSTVSWCLCSIVSGNAGYERWRESWTESTETQSSTESIFPASSWPRLPGPSPPGSQLLVTASGCEWKMLRAKAASQPGCPTKTSPPRCSSRSSVSSSVSSSVADAGSGAALIDDRPVTCVRSSPSHTAVVACISTLGYWILESWIMRWHMRLRTPISAGRDAR